MLRIDRRAFDVLSDAQRAEAQRLLASAEALAKANPLLTYKPHPKQVAFHEGREQIKAFLGGNRSGKTTAGILDDLIQAVDTNILPDHLRAYKKFEPPFHCRIITPGFDVMEGVVFQKLREWAPKNQLIGDRFDKAYEKSRRILRFKNGSFFDFLTFEQDLDKFGGTAKHRIHYDEEPPRDIRQEGQMRLLDYDGADEVFTMTPQHGLSWMYEEIWEPWEKHELDDGKVIVVSMDDNPYLSEKQKAKLLKGFSKEELIARREGRFVHFAGLIYDEFTRNFHVIPQGPVPENARVYVGIDPGMRHMAAIVWIYLTPEDTMVVFDELAIQGGTVREVCEQIKLVNLKHSKNGLPLLPDWYVIDPSARNIMHQTGRSDQMEFGDHGIVTILGQNSVTAGINRVKERLQTHRLLFMANCSQAIDQHLKYRWATPTRTENDPKEKPVKTQDHFPDAVRYVVASRPITPLPYEEELYLSPMEKAMRRDMEPWQRNKIPNTPMGGIFS